MKEEEIKSLKRKGLQHLAKQIGVKANQRNDVLISLLINHFVASSTDIKKEICKKPEDIEQKKKVEVKDINWIKPEDIEQKKKPNIVEVKDIKLNEVFTDITSIKKHSQPQKKKRRCAYNNEIEKEKNFDQWEQSVLQEITLIMKDNNNNIKDKTFKRKRYRTNDSVENINQSSTNIPIEEDKIPFKGFLKGKPKFLPLKYNIPSSSNSQLLSPLIKHKSTTSHTYSPLLSPLTLKPKEQQNPPYRITPHSIKLGIPSKRVEKIPFRMTPCLSQKAYERVDSNNKNKSLVTVTKTPRREDNDYSITLRNNSSETSTVSINPNQLKTRIYNTTKTPDSNIKTPFEEYRIHSENTDSNSLNSSLDKSFKIGRRSTSPLKPRILRFSQGTKHMS